MRCKWSLITISDINLNLIISIISVLLQKDVRFATQIESFVHALNWVEVPFVSRVKGNAVISEYCCEGYKPMTEYDYFRTWAMWWVSVILDVARLGYLTIQSDGILIYDFNLVDFNFLEWQNYSVDGYLDSNVDNKYLIRCFENINFNRCIAVR